MLRTAFLAECHFLLTLTAKEASIVLFGLSGGACACLRPLPVGGGRFWQVRIESRLARFDGCKILQLTLSGISRITKNQIFYLDSRFRGNDRITRAAWADLRFRPVPKGTGLPLGQAGCPYYKSGFPVSRE